MEKKNDMKVWLHRLQKPLILLAVVVILTILQPGSFLTFGNFKSILLAISVYGIMVCGTIFPILLGGIDLAVGATAAMSGATTVLMVVNSSYTTGSVILGLALGLLAGVCAGLFHGFVVSNFDVPPFLITLASQNIIYGIAQLLTGNQVISCLKPELFTFIGGGRLFGIPFSIFILVVCAALSYFILNHTTFGRQVYAVGGNRKAAALSGVSTKKLR